MSYTFENLNSKQRSREIYRLSENTTDELEVFLLEEFSVERNLTGIAFGFVTVSWIIALVILEKGSATSISKLKELIPKYWSKYEIDDFKSYISKSNSIQKI